MKKEKSIRVSEATYQRIKRIAANDKRTIKAVVEIALDSMEGLRKDKK